MRGVMKKRSARRPRTGILPGSYPLRDERSLAPPALYSIFFEFRSAAGMNVQGARSAGKSTRMRERIDSARASGMIASAS